MFACKALLRASLFSICGALSRTARAPCTWPVRTPRPSRSRAPLLCSGFRGTRTFPYSSSPAAAADCQEEISPDDTVEELLTKSDRVRRLMKMERRSDGGLEGEAGSLWFPYLDVFRSEAGTLTSREVVEAIGPYILESRKEKMKKVVEGRSYSICLVVEGLTDFGNVSAAFRSADALGIQSVHVISKDKSKRCC